MLAASTVGILTAFLAGAISFLSPCVLPLVPGYISYVSGNTLDQKGRSQGSRLTTLLLSAYFVLGFSTVFVALGASASAISRLLLSYRYEATIAGGVIVILFGVVTTGLVRIPWLERDLRIHRSLRSGGPLGAYILGFVFAFGWTPCIGPVLGAILTIGALSSTAATGVILLAAYSAGLGVPFMVTAIFTDGLLRGRRAIGRIGRLLQLGAGSVMMIMGVAMITGHMSIFSIWLLRHVPVLTQIG
ncbi:cytochrome c biogenesis CcdA family protein [Hypericibacter sp.]|uniref:cytochrome c biogenesis CcdA family protein n=1 Tax=Hypericibacter sp. TaxID=2705401 RepID=UPI003D6D797C